MRTPAEIDATNTDQLRATLRNHAGGVRGIVVVDMTGTTFCDASGLHALVAAHERAQAEGGEVRLVIPAGGPVARVIELTGTGSLIPCFTSMDKALA